MWERFKNLLGFGKGDEAEQPITVNIDPQALPVDTGTAPIDDTIRAQALQAVSMPPQTNKQILVVGGGISGQVAAYKLMKQGYQVTLLEEKNKLSGHIQIRENASPEGHYMDLGAECVDSKDKGLIAIANEVGVNVVERISEPGEDTYHVHGKYYTEAEASKLFEPLAEKIQVLKARLRDAEGKWSQEAQALDSLSMAAFLDQEIKNDPRISPEIVTMLKEVYRSETGRDPENISALSLVDFIKTDTSNGQFQVFGDSDEWGRIEGGTAKLTQALERELRAGGVNIIAGTRLTKIMETASGVSIETEGKSGERVELPTFDQVVMATTAPALSKIEGVQELGIPMMQSGSKDMQYTSLLKVAVPTKGRPWRDLGNSNGVFFSDGAYQTSWVSSTGQPADKDAQNGMVTFLIGGQAAEGKPSEIIQRAKEDYAKTLGKPVDEVFANVPPSFMQWTQPGQQCYVSPAPGQYIDLMNISDPATRISQGGRVALVGSYVPARYENGAKIGFMNNGVESALIEVERIHTRLQDRLVERADGMWANRIADTRQIARDAAIHALGA